MKLTTAIPAGAFAIITSFLLSSCGHPGGLSDEEWNTLSPARRAELTMQQQSLVEQEVHDAQQSQHWDKEDQKDKKSY